MGQVSFLPTIGGASAVGQGRGGHPYWTTAGRWRGLGQGCPVDPTLGVPICPDTTGSSGGGDGSGGPATSPQAQSGGIDLTSIITQGIKTTGAVVQQQYNPFAPKNIPAGTYYASGPGGTVISTAGAGSPYTAGALTTTSLTSGLSSMLPILLIGGVVIMMMGRR